MSDPLGMDGNIMVKNEICAEDLPSDNLPNLDEEIFGMVETPNLVAENQGIFHGKGGETAAGDQQGIIERLANLERKVDFLIQLNSRIMARAGRDCENMRRDPVDPVRSSQFPLKDVKGIQMIDAQIAKNRSKYNCVNMRKRTVESCHEFPLKDVKGLELIDAQIANDRGKYIEIFKLMLKPSGFGKHVERFFDRNVLMQMNYTGAKSQIGLSNYKNLNMALYESVKTSESFTIADHIKIVREAFFKFKNRVYKAQSKKRISNLKSS